MIVQVRSRFWLRFLILGTVLALLASGARGPAQDKKDSKRFRSTVVKLTDKAPDDWLLKEAKVGEKMLSDKGYTLSELPDEVKGGTFLLRTSADDKKWLKASAVEALKDTTVYALFRWKYLRKEVMGEGAFTKLEREGWKEVTGDTGTTFPAGEDWQWKTYKKKVKKGDVILQLKTLSWDNWAVLFIFK